MKKTLIKFSSVIFALLMLLAVCTALFAPVGIASADDTENTDIVKTKVIEAPTPESHLESNQYAGISTLKLVTGNDEVYIPESYFVLDKGIMNEYNPDIHVVEYAGHEFYLMGEPTVTEITVADGELLFPNVFLKLKNEEPVRIGFVNITNDYTIKFLGYNESGTNIYVSASIGSNTPIPGFIPKDSVEPFEVPYQTRTQAKYDEMHAPPPNTPIIEDGHFAPNTSVALRVIIIIGIAIPTVLIVLLLFKPSKNDRKYSKNSVRNTRSRDEFDYDDSRSYRRRDDRDDRDYDRRDDRDRDYDRRDDRDYDRRYDDRDYDRRDKRDDYR